MNINTVEIARKMAERLEQTKSQEAEKLQHMKLYYLVLLFAEFRKRGGQQMQFNDPKLNGAFNIWRSDGNKVETLLKKQFGHEYETIVQEEKDVFHAVFDSIFSEGKTADEKVWLLNVITDLTTNRGEIAIKAEEYNKQQREEITHQQFSEYFWWFRNNVLWYVQNGDTIFGAFNRIIVEQNILPDKDGKYK